MQIAELLSAAEGHVMAPINWLHNISRYLCLESRLQQVASICDKESHHGPADLLGHHVT